MLFDVDIDYLGFGGAYSFTEGTHAGPYLAGTLGITRFTPESGGYKAKNRGHLSFGLGTNVMLSKSFGLKFEGRGYATFLDSDGAMFCGNGGCRVFVASSTLLQYELIAGINFVF